MKEKCDEPECKCEGKELVDKGYGFPVCRLQSVSLRPVKMNPLWEKEGYEKLY